MKKLYILTLLSIAGFSANAQNFVYSTTMHVDEVMVNAFEIYDIKFTTPTPEDITFEWERISNTFESGWDYSLCDYTGCYVGVPPAGTMTPITSAEATSGTEGFFKMNIGHVGVNGDGFVQLYVYDSNNYSRGDTVSFHLSMATASIGELANDAVTVYPNPAADIISIDGEGYSSLVIVNALGEQVKTVNGDLTGTIDVSNLEDGMYILSFQNEAGLKFTKRLIIQ